MTKLIDQINAPRPFGDRLDGKEGEIIRAAYRCVVERGIAATTTHAVADYAGINQGNIHYYFRTKDALLERLLEEMFSNSVNNIRAVANGDLSPREKMSLILSLGSSLVGPRRDELVVFFAFWAHAMSNGGNWRQLYVDLFRKFRGTIVAILKQEQWSQFNIKGGEEAVASMVVAIVQGLGLQYIMDPAAVEQADLDAALNDLFDNVLVGGAAAVPPIEASQEEYGI